MTAEALPPLRFSEAPADFITLHQEGRIPVLYPLPEEEGGVVAIVPDKPLKPGILTHWQRDPEDLSRIIFTGPRGKLVTTATPYLLSHSQAKTVEAIIKP